MKFVAFAVMALALAGCKEDKGVHLGTFKDDCAAKNGVFARADGSSNEYTCTLADGTVLRTKDK